MDIPYAFPPSCWSKAMALSSQTSSKNSKHALNVLQSSLLSTFCEHLRSRCFSTGVGYDRVGPFSSHYQSWKGAVNTQHVQGCLYVLPTVGVYPRRVHPDCLYYALNGAEMCSGPCFDKSTCEIHVQKLSWMEWAARWWQGSARVDFGAPKHLLHITIKDFDHCLH